VALLRGHIHKSFLPGFFLKLSGPVEKIYFFCTQAHKCRPFPPEGCNPRYINGLQKMELLIVN